MPPVCYRPQYPYACRPVHRIAFHRSSRHCPRCSDFANLDYQLSTDCSVDRLRRSPSVQSRDVRLPSRRTSPRDERLAWPAPFTSTAPVLVAGAPRLPYQQWRSSRSQRLALPVRAVALFSAPGHPSKHVHRRPTGYTGGHSNPSPRPRQPRRWVIFESLRPLQPRRTAHYRRRTSSPASGPIRSISFPSLRLMRATALRVVYRRTVLLDVPVFFYRPRVNFLTCD